MNTFAQTNKNIGIVFATALFVSASVALSSFAEASVVRLPRGLTVSVPSIGVVGGSGNNGGVVAGAGGSGGTAANGGTVTTGETTASSSAFNRVNTTVLIIRIGR